VKSSDHGRDILLAEDNLGDAELLRLAFRQHGRQPCRLHVVHDGEAVLAFLRQEGFYAGTPRPHLLLLDIGLPKIGGWQVLETIRATTALAALPVVMLTGIMTREDEERRAALQPLACFEKPMQLGAYRHLVAELEQLLNAMPSQG
jgi:chemotaxis family two-component system response regulator Rcp1